MCCFSPGDAQEGAWEHVLNDQNTLALIENADFYKVGHHGSHNATPKAFVLTGWHGTGDAMVPWGLVEAWKHTIPKKELLDALTEKQHRVILPKRSGRDRVRRTPQRTSCKPSGGLS